MSRAKKVSAPAVSLLRMLREMGYTEADNRMLFFRGFMEKLDILVTELVNADKAYTDATGIHFRSPLNLKPMYSPEFETFWNIYPRKIGKAIAWKRWIRLLYMDEQPSDMLKAAAAYQRKVKLDGTEQKYILHPSTFLYDERWKDYLGTGEPSKFDEMEEA